MHSILLDKVRAWAAGSGGCFPVRKMDENGQRTTHVAKYDGSSIFQWGKVGFTQCTRKQEYSKMKGKQHNIRKLTSVWCCRDYLCLKDSIPVSPDELFFAAEARQRAYVQFSSSLPLHCQCHITFKL
jgi:hypothetical protein